MVDSNCNLYGVKWIPLEIPCNALCNNKSDMHCKLTLSVCRLI